MKKSQHMAFNIWRITDGKAGHDSQSIGLCNAIEKLKSCQRFDILANSLLSIGKNFILNQFSLGEDLPDPDLIIGAGHSTHLTMLCAKCARKGKTIVLMKPCLPPFLFNTCIIPEHDQVANRNNIIKSKGAINPIQFNQNKSENIGLILLGGSSKHYQWNNDSILDQIKKIVRHHPEIHWKIADSPRTPKHIMDRIANLTCKNIDVLNFSKTDSKTIHDIIFKADSIWVSKDSVSMVYEALSSGAAVGLLDLVQKKNSNISAAINNLINDKQLSSFRMWENTNKLKPPSVKFNEADRCASLLLERGVLA